MTSAPGPATSSPPVVPQEPEPHLPDPEPLPKPVAPPPVWGGDPDVGVSSSYLRLLAGECEGVAGRIRTTTGAAEEAGWAVARQDAGWTFVGSLQDMHARWEALNDVITGRLTEAAGNFSDSAAAFDGTDTEVGADLDFRH